ncbi:ABC transporter [Candidatus Peregrinibacteria bacterium HGW-Peregrinibacteria-1]|jgi:ABC-2 type transport system permease protein|nr:MAG: ABC transporter [Candidatus Peregrinibacteria bacterium HGW-Peregrinibacteria-1]
MNLTGAMTLFKRETHRYLKVYSQTILTPVISNLLFLMIFGLSIGRDIPGSDLSYLQFVVPGLVMMGIINNAYQNPSSSIIIMKYQGLISNLLTIPLSKGEILWAFLASAVLRGLLVGVVTLITALFFVQVGFYSILYIVLASFFSALLFSALGVIVGVWAKSFDQTTFVFSFLLSPLIFLGGVFYPITTLPDLFQTISMFNPIVYMVDLLRYGFTGYHEFALLLDVSVVLGFSLVLTAVSYLILRTGWRMQT